VGYLDAAVDRIGHESRRDFVDAVEAVRTGYAAATDRKASSRWGTIRTKLEAQLAAATAGPGGIGLTGETLERALTSLLITNPDIVAVRVMPRG